jgi:dihydroorotase
LILPAFAFLFLSIATIGGHPWAGLGLPEAPPPQAPGQTALDTEAYDLVINNGRVMDPETRLDQPGTNVAVRGGRIAVVTREAIRGRKEIDAAGRVVAPGFIDMVSYDPNPAGVWNKIADGVTTNLALHGGTTDPPAWYGYYVAHRPPVNYGASFFFSVARNELQIPLTAPATPQQIEQLAARGERALREGALAVAFSLEYVPGIRREEILPLMRLARRYRVPVFFHARYSTMEGPGTNLVALQEIIDACRETGASAEIEHITSTGGTFSMPQSLAMLDAARASGLDITADAYPYTYWATYLDSERFAPGWQQRFRITYSNLQIAGSTERLTAESFARYRHQHRVAAAFAIPEEDVTNAIRSPWIMIASDGILDAGHNNHPRASGTFTRTLAVYVREKKALTLMDALAKMTILPARRLEQSSAQFRRKGRLSPGADADIVIFDPATVADRASVEHPETPAEGIEWVLVNGTVVKSPAGFQRSAHPGEALRGDPAARAELARARP